VTASCIYEGTIRHRRSEPRSAFSHRIGLAYIDLDELPGLLGGRLVRRRPGLVRFRRRDYLGDPAVPLGQVVRDTVGAHTGIPTCGPIRVLTQPRSYGHCFNPVTFYYCFDAAGERVQAVVAEVTNTPWGERHAYVLPALRACFDKALHVSPFLAMDQRYEARLSTPADTLSVHIASRPAGFDATLRLQRIELDRRSLARLSARYPLACVRVLALIYGHALALALAGARVHPHPAR
jgi:DUF1365 family protein